MCLAVQLQQGRNKGTTQASMPSWYPLLCKDADAALVSCWLLLRTYAAVETCVTRVTAPLTHRHAICSCTAEGCAAVETCVTRVTAPLTIGTQSAAVQQKARGISYSVCHLQAGLEDNPPVYILGGNIVPPRLIGNDDYTNHLRASNLTLYSSIPI